MSDELSQWADRLDAAVASLRFLDRAAVVAETASTQDLAATMAAGRPGLVLAAGRQTGGRGRLGRRWIDAPGKGLAMTLVLDAAAVPLETLTLGAGLGACAAAESALPRPALGLRWPNDVVEPASGRKLAGVLVEQRGGLWLVGVGLNALQQERDWPEDLAGRACSLAQLGATCSRGDTLERLVVEIDRALSLAPQALSDQWHARDTLVGTVRTFVSGGRTVRGVVESVEPSSAIVVRAGDGLHLLRAQDSSLVHDGAHP